MTFSDASVASLVNANFACAWKNLQPGFDAHGGLNRQFKDAAACRMIPEGHSDKNIVSVFATPDLKVLHAVPGYWTPQRFIEEIRLVLELRKEVLDGDSSLRADRKGRFGELHGRHARAHDEQAAKSAGETDPVGEIQRSMGHGRTKSDLQKLLAAVHRDRAGHWEETAEEFEKRFRAEQIGNFFKGR